MEVTPIDLRGLHVSVGDGAQPHGRDMSLSQRKTSTSSTNDGHKTVPLPIEVPIDPIKQQLVASLLRAAPDLDPGIAEKIASLLLGGASQKPVPLEGESANGGHLDVQL